MNNQGAYPIGIRRLNRPPLLLAPIPSLHQCRGARSFSWFCSLFEPLRHVRLLPCVRKFGPSPNLHPGTMPSADSCTHLGSQALARASDTAKPVQVSRGKPPLLQHVAPDLPASLPNDYRASRFMGRLPRFTGLVSGFCSSLRTFVSRFLQIPSRPGHRPYDSDVGINSFITF